MIPGTNAWHGLLRFWLNPQTGLPEVPRWEKYRKEENGGARPQNSLQHSYSIGLLAHHLRILLSDFLPNVDWLMLQHAVDVHDIGEGELGRDVHFIDKRPEGDVEEWIAFRELTDGLPESTKLAHRQAFLLQFCLDDEKVTIFPSEAQQLMDELAAHYRMEALLFDAIERIDYIMYAQEQYDKLDNRIILVQTLRHQIRRLNELALEIPGFGQTIWTKEVRVWHQHFLDGHSGDWPENRSA